MYRLIIKLTLIFLLIFFFYTNPIPVACFCGNSSWWNRCIEGTEESSIMCREIDFIINTINDQLRFISEALSTVFNTLSQDIPLIPTDIPKVADLVSSKYTNYTIDSVPRIQNISLSCPIIIPLSIITTETNKAISHINNELTNIIDKINSNPFFTAINDIKNKIIIIRNYINSINFGSVLNGKLRLSCNSGYQLNGLVCLRNAPDGYTINPGDVVSYHLTESKSYLKGPGRTADQDNSACNGLSNVAYGIGTCTGWNSCDHRTPRWCVKNVNCCDWDWKRFRCGRTCSETCVGNDCIGAAPTRNAPRRCPEGTEFDLWKVLCYTKCRNGYSDRGGSDVINCWNDKPWTKIITDTHFPKITFE